MNPVDEFKAECRAQQPMLDADAQRFFNGVIALPIEQERLLQAYIVKNLQRYFGTSGELILFEHPLPRQTPDQGKYDLIFDVEDKGILLIETKYLMLDSGKTACTRRTKHRAKVIAQALKARDEITNNWDIPLTIARCCVFSNDDLVSNRARENEIEAGFVTDEALTDWRNREYERLFGKNKNFQIED